MSVPIQFVRRPASVIDQVSSIESQKKPNIILLSLTMLDVRRIGMKSPDCD